MTDNTRLGILGRLVPHYKEMWQVGKKQSWRCAECDADISHDPDWVCSLVKQIALCGNCGYKIFGKIEDD